jgi:type IV secretory pathway TraG/TraD family ATPase VirD4
MEEKNINHSVLSGANSNIAPWNRFSRNDILIRRTFDMRELITYVQSPSLSRFR